MKTDKPEIFLEVDSEIIFYIILRNHMNFKKFRLCFFIFLKNVSVFSLYE